MKDKLVTAKLLELIRLATILDTETFPDVILLATIVEAVTFVTDKLLVVASVEIIDPVVNVKVFIPPLTSKFAVGLVVLRPTLAVSGLI